jgi:hypothetical protein
MCRFQKLLGVRPRRDPDGALALAPIPADRLPEQPVQRAGVSQRGGPGLDPTVHEMQPADQVRPGRDLGVEGIDAYDHDATSTEAG